MRFLALLVVALAALVGVSAKPYGRMVNRVSASILRVTGEKDVETVFGPMHAAYVCSGFVIAPHRVLTAAHCTGDHMLADGGPVSLLKKDEYYDLALLSTVSTKAPLILRDTPVVRFEYLTGIGYAWGWSRLSVLREQAFLIDHPAPEDEDQTAPGLIVRGGYIGGMSGGPVVDDHGQVVGVIQRTNDGIGYGVGVLLVRAFLLGV